MSMKMNLLEGFKRRSEGAAYQDGNLEDLGSVVARVLEGVLQESEDGNESKNNNTL